MPEFDVNTNVQAGSVFEQTLASEQRARSFETPREPSGAEKVAAALPSIISAGATLYGAAKQSAAKSADEAMKREVAEGFSKAQSAVEQGTLSGTAARAQFNKVRTEMINSALEEGNLDKADLILKAHGNLTAGQKDLFAPTVQEQVDASRLKGTLAAEQADAERRQLMSKSGMSGNRIQEALRNEAEAAAANNEINRLKAESNLTLRNVAGTLDKALVSGRRALTDNLQVSLSQLDTTDPDYTAKYSNLIRESRLQMQSYIDDIQTGIVSKLGPEERKEAMSMIVDQQKVLEDNLTNKDLTKMLEEDSKARGHASEIWGYKNAPILTRLGKISSDLPGKYLDYANNPRLRNVMLKAFPMLRKATESDLNENIFDVFGASLGQDTGVDPNSSEAIQMRVSVQNDPNAPTAIRDQALDQTLFGDLKARASNDPERYKVFASINTTTSQASILKDPKRQAELKNQLNIQKNQLRHEFESDFGEEGTANLKGMSLSAEFKKEGNSYKLVFPTLKKDINAFSDSVEDEVDREEAMRHAQNFRTHYINKIQPLLTTMTTYKDLFDDNPAQFMKDIMGVDIKVKESSATQFIRQNP